MEQRQGQRPRLTCKTMFVLGAMNMIDCINVNLLTPYVDRMVSSFLEVDTDDPKVALFVGLLIGLYSLCEVCFSPMWGTLADRVGRKPALMIGLGGSVIAPIMFGLGTDLKVVFVARALDGFFCGNMGVTRTYMGEIVDETNEARGYSFLAVCFSLGLFIGPVLGGELVYPADFAPSIFKDTVFDRYPFLLPNLTYAIFAAVAWVIGFIALEETLPYNERRGICGFGGGAGAVQMDGPPLSSTLSSGRPMSRQTSGTDPLGRPCWEPSDPAESERPDPPPRRRFYPRELLQCIVAYCAMSGYFSAWVQLFVLIVSFPRDRDGFALGPSQIGWLQNVSAAALLLTQLVLYPLITKKIGFFRSFYMGWCLTVLTHVLFPVYGIFADPERYHSWRYLPLCFMQFFGAIGAGFLYPTALALINRAAAGLEKGAVNGWANSSGAFCRSVFPPAAGLILGWSSKSGVELLRYTAVYINLFVGTAMLLFAAPGIHKAEQQGLRRQPNQQQQPQQQHGRSSEAATDEAAQRGQPLVKE